MSSETLLAIEWNRLEQEMCEANILKLSHFSIPMRELQILFDLARANPLPAVDASIDDLEAGLIAAKEGT